MASRREFLGVSATAGIALLLGPAGCEDDEVPAPQSGAPQPVRFDHGIASGEPRADKVLLWTRVSGAGAPVAVRWRVSEDPTFATEDVASGAFETDASRDFTGLAEVGGLRAATTYFYRFESEGVESEIGRTRTLPGAGAAVARFAVVSCASLAHGHFNVYAALAERDDIDFVLHLGDYIYEYGNGPDAYAAGERVAGRLYEPDGVVRSLADYRTRHAQYKRDPDLRALHARHPVLAIWDDHEFADDCWGEGARDVGKDEDWADRRAAAARAYFEWMPVPSPALEGGSLHRRVDLGALASIYVVDVRTRDRSAPLEPAVDAGDGNEAMLDLPGSEDAGRSMLGEAQEQWLFAGLRDPAPKWRLLANPSKLAQVRLAGLPEVAGGGAYYFRDTWDGYSGTRDRLFAALAGGNGHARVENFVALGGDLHSSWANELTANPNDPLRYDPVTGADATGARATLGVEFTAPAVSSPGARDLHDARDALRVLNPHLKYVDLIERGYLLVDVQEARARAEFWFVDTVEKRGAKTRLAASFEVLDREGRLRAAEGPGD